MTINREAIGSYFVGVCCALSEGRHDDAEALVKKAIAELPPDLQSNLKDALGALALEEQKRVRHSTKILVARAVAAVLLDEGGPDL